MAAPVVPIRDVREALAALKDEQEIAVDIETSGLSFLHDKIAVVTLCGSKSGRVAVLHIRGKMPPELRDFLSEAGRRHITHNGAGFDLLFLRRAGVDVFGPTQYDTMIGELATLKTSRRDVSVSLKATTARHLGKKLNKDIEHSGWMNWELSDEQLEYCVGDIVYMRDIRKKQLAKAEESGTTRAVETEMRLMPAVVSMTLNGLPMNLRRLTAYLGQQNVLALESGDYLRQKFNAPDINLNSPLQVKKALESIGLGVESTAKEVLKELVLVTEGEPKEIFEAMLNSSYARQRIKMYNPDWVAKNLVDEFVHARFWQCVARGTLVEMPRDLTQHPDGVPIEQVKPGDSVYSYDSNQQLRVKRVLRVGATGVKKLIKVKAYCKAAKDTVELRITPDHLVRLWSGGWKKAGELELGDRLRCMPRRNRFGDYASFSLYSGSAGFATSPKRHEHQFVAQETLGPRPEGSVVHHIDGNTLNNTTSNLEYKTIADHTRDHYRATDESLFGADRPRTWRRIARHRGLIEPKIPMSAEDVQSALAGVVAPRVKPDTLRKLAKSFGLVPAGMCVVDGELRGKHQGRSTTNHTVISIEEDGEDEVWDMEVEDTHTFIANGVAVHNCGTETGRFSSSDPNLQQVPKDMRWVFKAPPGKKVVSIDFSQLEVRVAAAISQDQELLDAFNSEDVHTMIGCKVFECSPAELTKERRKLAKAMVFTLLFGGGTNRFYSYARINGSAITRDEAEAMGKAFFVRFRGIERMRFAAYKAVNKRAPITLTLPTGIKRTLMGATLTPTVLLNTTVQGTAAGGMKYAIIKAWEQGLVLGRLGAQVHDELVATVKESEAREYADALSVCMIEGMREALPDCPAAVEATIDDAWGPLPHSMEMEQAA